MAGLNGPDNKLCQLSKEIKDYYLIVTCNIMEL